MILAIYVLFCSPFFHSWTSQSRFLNSLLFEWSLLMEEIWRTAVIGLLGCSLSTGAEVVPPSILATCKVWYWTPLSFPLKKTKQHFRYHFFPWKKWMAENHWKSASLNLHFCRWTYFPISRGSWIHNLNWSPQRLQKKCWDFFGQQGILPSHFLRFTQKRSVFDFNEPRPVNEQHRQRKQISQRDGFTW